MEDKRLKNRCGPADGGRPRQLPTCFLTSRPAMFKLRFPKTGLTLAFGALLALICGALGGALLALTRDLPQILSLEGFSPSAVTRIYSADEVLLAEVFQENRDPVALSEIPADLIAALLTTEDRNFYRHSGVDPKGVMRAIAKNIRAGTFAEGASTITQQIAKTLFLTPKKTLVRKLREAILAFQLERRYTKDEILALYLNQIYLGSGAYGVAAAARRYFDKPVEDLDLAECALIAGLPRAPSRYSPLANPELALARRNLVLRQMRDTGAISAERYQLALSTPLQPITDSRPSATAAAYFVEAVKAELEAAVGPAGLYREGLRVTTTLSSRLQTAAESAVRKGLVPLNAAKSPAAGSAPVEGALICLDIRTGGILALVGGSDFATRPYNRASVARRQPGSAFKPLLFACAVEQGFTQASLLLDAPVVFRGADQGRDWKPENFGQSFDGEMPLRKALALSKNIPAVRLMEKVGPHAVVRFAHRLGIESPLQPQPGPGPGHRRADARGADRGLCRLRPPGQSCPALRRRGGAGSRGPGRLARPAPEKRRHVPRGRRNHHRPADRSGPRGHRPRRRGPRAPAGRQNRDHQRIPRRPVCGVLAGDRRGGLGRPGRPAPDRPGGHRRSCRTADLDRLHAGGARRAADSGF